MAFPNVVYLRHGIIQWQVHDDGHPGRKRNQCVGCQLQRQAIARVTSAEQKTDVPSQWDSSPSSMLLSFLPYACSVGARYTNLSGMSA